MRIEVLGPGCAKCKVLYEHVDRAAKELGLDYEMEKVTDINVILGYGVMGTPALVVDGKVKFSGRVPSPEQIREMLS
ncbi:MAG: thioredoxin family protein [Candidatus Binatia bacterium]